MPDKLPHDDNSTEINGTSKLRFLLHCHRQRMSSFPATLRAMSHFIVCSHISCLIAVRILHFCRQGGHVSLWLSLLRHLFLRQLPNVHAVGTPSPKHPLMHAPLLFCDFFLLRIWECENVRMRIPCYRCLGNRCMCFWLTKLNFNFNRFVSYGEGHTRLDHILVR